MKTVKQHLETLPEPYRSKALGQCDLWQGSAEVETLIEAIQNINWNKSVEGHIFWFSLCKAINERDRILDKLNSLDYRRYTSKQIIDELKRWANDI